MRSHRPETGDLGGRARYCPPGAMKAASISYRVADFLGRHPPFEWMEEQERVDLAMSGRVRFHESHEVLHDAGEERQSEFAVIQQGTIELLGQGDELRDLLGPGDIVGIGSSERHRYCARTASDVLVYVFPQDVLHPLLDRHPRVRRYLEAVFSLAGEDRAGGFASLGPSSLWLDEPLPPEIARCDASLCRPESPIRDIARRMTREGLSAVAIVDDDGRPLGIVRDSDLRAHVVAGEVAPQAPVGELLPFVVDALAPADEGQPLGQYWRRMLRSEASALPIMAGSSGSGPVLGVLTENDLALRLAHDPLVPILRIARARDLRQIRSLRVTAETAIDHLLADRNSAPWAVEAAGALDVSTCRRIIERAEAETGSAEAPTPRCWILLGAAGRRERFGAMPLGLGLIWGGPPESRVAMNRLADRVGAELGEVGIRLAFHTLPSVGGIPTHGTVEEWKAAYEGWVRDPIGTGMYEALGFFDVLPIAGETGLAGQVIEHLRMAVAEDDAFLPLLANDSMAHLPPLTFFRGQVVDKAGERTELLHLENCAVRPLTDIARVFALQGGSAAGESGTASRLRRSAESLLPHQRLLGRSAEAFELALLQRARVAYATPDDRPEIRPEALLKVDRELLKSCFRTILDLLEMTAAHFGFPMRR